MTELEAQRARILQQIAKDNLVTLHFFDTSGRKKATSEEQLFKRHLISRQMSHQALRELNKNRMDIFHNVESVGDFAHQTYYNAIQDQNGKLIGYLQMPLYSIMQRQGAVIARLFGYLITFLWFAFFLFNFRILRSAAKTLEPIKKLTESISALQITGSNASLEYEYEDEFSEVVTAYNRQAKEIVKKTEALETMTKENTWRSIAEQVAHEINNGLFPLKIPLQRFEMRRKAGERITDEEIEKMHAMLLRQVTTFERMFKSFRDMAKVITPKSDYILWNDLFSHVQTGFNNYKSPKDGAIKVEVKYVFIAPKKQFTIHADPDFLYTAMQNLLINAYEAMPPEQRDNNQVVAELVENNGKVEFRVTDNGMGMTDDVKVKILSTEFSTKNYGSGLGLFHSKTSIESMNGKLFFQTEYGVGSTFTISFELQNATPIV